MIKKEFNDIIINNKIYKVIINRKNNKNTYIRIDEQFNIVVNTNHFTPIKQLKNLILKNQDKIEKMVHNKKQRALLSHQLAYLGKIYEIIFINHTHFEYDIKHKEIVFYTNLSKSDTIDLFYKQEAKILLPQRFKHCFKHFNQFYHVKYPNLSIRKMKTRFGTCYYNKNQINLNSHLIKYNIERIDYVIYHELSHLIHHHHGKKFYELLDKIYPNHSSVRKNLNKY